MPITNLNSDHFTEEERNVIEKNWDSIMNIMRAKARNLSPDERSKYGSVNEENKLVVQKVLEYHRNQPHLDCPEVDYKELQDDWDDRMFLAGFVSRMLEATNIANNIRITHDYDAFQNARVDYNHAKYKMDTMPGAGFERKYRDLLYFFKTNTTTGGNTGETPADPAAPEPSSK